MFRATFDLPSSPVRARLYISGLGYHRSFLNGIRVSPFELGSFTTFQKRTLYDVMDVTSALKQGPLVSTFSFVLMVELFTPSG